MQRKTYWGKLTYTPNGKETDILDLAYDKHYTRGSLSEEILGDLLALGRFLYVQYYISDKPIEPSYLVQAFSSDCEQGDTPRVIASFETAFFVQTDDDLNVGEDNLIEKLKPYVGNYLFMNIGYLRSSPHPAPHVEAGTGKRVDSLLR